MGSPTMVIVIMGPSGAGKTTVATALARDLGWNLVDADDLHLPTSRARMSRGEALSDDDRRPWLLALRAEIDRSLAVGDNMVIACSALKAEHRRILGSHRVGVRMVYLRADRATLEQRLKTRRNHFAGVSILDSQLDSLEEPRDALYVDAALPLESQIAAIQSMLNDGAPDDPFAHR